MPAESGVARLKAEQGVPPEPLIHLFLRYLRFGALAWGGPVAQIGMIRQELVNEKQWVSAGRFDRTLAVYQALPGPEAHELCVHYGMLSRGRVGGLLAGVGFMLPGFALMFLLSWLYATYGLTSPILLAAFTGMRPAVVALVVRATHRLGLHALPSAYLLGVAISTAFATLLGVPFFVTLPVAGAAYFLARRGRAWFGVVVAVLTLGVLAGWTGATGGAAWPPEADLEDGGGDGKPAPWELFVSGLKAGSLTFGGAYTVIPFLEADATGPDGWMSRAQFLEGIALGGVLPAPLIIFATFVGFVGGGAMGAVAMTVGIFAPAFAFTLVAQRHLERVILDARLHDFLDGVTAGVIGLIAYTAFALLLATILDGFAAIVFVAALVAQYVWRSNAQVPVIVLVAGFVGAVLPWVR